MFVKCSEHRKSTQLNGGLKITSSFHSKLGMIYLLLISWPTYSIQLSTEKLQDHKFSSLHRAGRYHKNVKETIAPFIFVSCVSRPPPHKPICLHIKICRNILCKETFSPGAGGEIWKCLGQQSSSQMLGHSVRKGKFTNQYRSISHQHMPAEHQPWFSPIFFKHAGFLAYPLFSYF